MRWCCVVRDPSRFAYTILRISHCNGVMVISLAIVRSRFVGYNEPPVYVFIAVSVIPRPTTSLSVDVAPSSYKVGRRINVGHVPDGA